VYYQPHRRWTLSLRLAGKATPEGFILVHDPTGQANAMNLTAIEQAGAVATIEMVKQQAVLETERRLKRDFLEDLLTGDYQATEAILARARSLGWDLHHKRVVLLVEINHFEQYYLTHIQQGEPWFQQIKGHFFETVARIVLAQNSENILVDRSDSIVILPHFEQETPLSLAQRATQALAKAIYAESTALLSGLDISVAVGSFYDTVDGLRHSHHEARAALAAGRRLSGEQPIIWYEDVALYVLLNRFAHQSEVRRWVDMTLGKLITYDEKNNTELVKTLETYFDTNQVSQQTAQALYIHPKTLKYRLRRIEEILGDTPFDGDRQLSFYLATKLIRFL
jgi:purine catabolism regulator